MKFILLFLLMGCILSPKIECLDSVSGYEYHPGTMKAEPFLGRLILTDSFMSQEGHKKRRHSVKRWNLKYNIKDLPNTYTCAGVSDQTLKKYMKPDVGSVLAVSGIYLFQPMNGRKVGLQIRKVNNEPMNLSFEVSCDFPRPNYNFTEVPAQI